MAQIKKRIEENLKHNIHRNMSGRDRMKSKEEETFDIKAKAIKKLYKEVDTNENKSKNVS
jgi:hypothetical protein